MNDYLTVIGKRGIYKERLEALVKQFEDEEDYATAFDLEALEEQLESDVAKGKIGRITAKSLISRAQQSKIARMFINAGYTVEQAAEEVGVSVDTLINEKNWDGSIFTVPKTGAMWHFVFNYNKESVWERMV